MVDIFTYTPDMTRPNCPICGCPVPEPLSSGPDPRPDPSIPWVGTCAHGHTHTYQLDTTPSDPEPPSPSLLTEQQRQQLLHNGHRTENGEAIDPRPVVKLFTPDAGATWLLTEMDPNAPDMMFGLCDLGLGEPELGYVSLSELQNLLGPLGLPVERDLHFTPDRPLSAYTEDARRVGRIIT